MTVIKTASMSRRCLARRNDNFLDALPESALNQAMMKNGYPYENPYVRLNLPHRL